jgi:hypothetical protein
MGVIFVIIAVAAFLIYETYNGGFTSAMKSDCVSPNCFNCQDANMPDCCCQITNDPNTWPTGDRIWLVCHAIGYAEGANVAGSNPDRLNNPGDISDGYNEYGGENHSGSNITSFPNKHTGWNWLYSKVSNMANGNSHIYSASDTWTIIAQKWAGDWQNWLKNVTDVLGVSPDSTLQDYLNA